MSVDSKVIFSLAMACSNFVWRRRQKLTPPTNVIIINEVLFLRLTTQGAPILESNRRPKRSPRKSQFLCRTIGIKYFTKSMQIATVSRRYAYAAIFFSLPLCASPILSVLSGHVHSGLHNGLPRIASPLPCMPCLLGRKQYATA